MAKPNPKFIQFNEFYSYPAWVIARWLGVCIRTAKNYKAGKGCPRPALRLFTLMRDRRVMIDEAWDGWTVDGNKLTTPQGQSMTPSMLQAWYYVYLERDELKRDRERHATHVASNSNTSAASQAS